MLLVPACAQFLPAALGKGFSTVATETYAYPHGYATDIAGDGRFTYIATGVPATESPLADSTLGPTAAEAHGRGGGRFRSPGGARPGKPALRGRRAGSKGPHIFDITSRSNPRLLTIIPGRWKVRALQVKGRFLYVPYQDAVVSDHDITNPASPALVGRLAMPLPGYISGIRGGGRLRLPHGAGKLYAVSVANPSSPQQTAQVGGELPLGDFIAIAHGYLFIPDKLGMEGGSIADPAHPQPVGRLQEPALPPNLYGAAGAAG